MSSVASFLSFLDATLAKGDAIPAEYDPNAEPPLLADANPLVPAKAENGEAPAAPAPKADVDLPKGVEGAGAADDLAQAGTALAVVVDAALGVCGGADEVNPVAEVEAAARLAGAGVAGVAAEIEPGEPSPKVDFALGFCCSVELALGDAPNVEAVSRADAEVLTAENGEDAEENAEKDCTKTSKSALRRQQKHRSLLFSERRVDLTMQPAQVQGPRSS